ncbi:hypothetical protein JKF63_01774 [Porcisia hertigi]|uniref:Uncharacterized protein n=1 Tax=Porcisia hertigi TaxID=2761500 RepID=A0A836L1N4_9TRYP|nr:hypothetical protein JKF63_01774 [Porcisia hertigi]
MYTSEAFRKKIRTNAPVTATPRLLGHSLNPQSALPPLNENSGPSVTSLPLHRGDPSYNSLQSPRSSSHFPITPHTALMSLPSDGVERTRHIVMDPLAALRRCLQYVCSHPEVYGDDVRGLLDREVMHVVRLKASELSLTHGERPLFVDSLECATVRKAARRLQRAPALPPSTVIPPSSPPTNGILPGTVFAGDLFGYGSISFLPATSIDFNALLRDSRSDGAEAIHGEDSYRGDQGGGFSCAFSRPASVLGDTLPRDEEIQWGGTLPPSSLSPKWRDLGTPFSDAEMQNEARGNVGAAKDIATDSDGVHHYRTRHASASLPRGGDASGWHDRLKTLGPAKVLGSHDYTPKDQTVALANAFCAADSGVVVDQQGYEVTYLRTQLQQLEAAFNSKCVRMHELERENQHLADEMKTLERARVEWAAQNHSMKGQLEVLRRELDGWKDRANDAVAAVTMQNKRHNQHAKQIANSQLSEAKVEISRLNQLWRETERALQEARRSFENTEREAVAAHNHLADVFHYLERLERRVARRDAYVSLCHRRQQSLEEKYEKLRWAYEELSTLEGRYSYVDYILTTKPLWTVYMFVRLAQRLGDYVALENPAEVQQRLLLMAGEPDAPNVLSETALATLESMKPLYGLMFSRTPHGGRLVAELYDVRLVFCTIVDEATAEINRRGRLKQTCTNLHGSVGCRVVRWYERYSIDYLRAQDSDPDNGDMNRKFVPLLTLASVLLPLRSRTGSVLIQPTPLEGASSPGRESTAAVGEQAATSEEECVHTLLSTIPNKHRYDEATIRFVLRSFWKERLGAFSRQMSVRLTGVQTQWELENTRHSETGGQDNFSDSARPSTAGSFSPPGDAKNLDDDDAIVIQSFLAALVDFSTRFSVQCAGSATAETVKTTYTPSKATLLSVRGVLTGGTHFMRPGGRGVPSVLSPKKKATSDSVWDCGRVFFATVLQPVRTALPKDAQVSPSTDLPTPEEVTILAEDAREILAALYYYTLEYKDVDSEFRLFYLVAHQLIPEMVAVNFFAGLEAFQRECAALLESRLQRLLSGSQSAVTGTSASQPFSSPAVPKEVEDPLTALTRVVDVMDEALLDGEEEDIEPDSDGDGYGTILPLHPKVEAQPRPSTASPASEGQPLEEKKKDDASVGETKSEDRAVTQRARELRLLHNVRSYLRQRRPSMQGEEANNHDSFDAEAGGSDAQLNGIVKTSAGSRLPVSPFCTEVSEWTALEEKVVNSIGPHTALLDAFRLHCGEQRKRGVVARKGRRVKTEKELDYLRTRRAQRARRHERTKHLSATRGLLSIEDVLTLVERHCLATYAVSCCGTPRFSLVRSFFNRGGDTVPDAPPEIDPYAIVGHLPLTGVHLQRLRFALSLDQPSNLLRPSALFAVDPVTKSNSHFYDAYLTIVLDVFQQQQSFLMHSVLRSCAARHEEYAAEGSEECDGGIPISWLKKGLTAAFSSIRGTPLHAHAVLDHLVQYDELLRLEDDVRLEQFTDAPLFLNVPPSSGQRSSTVDEDSSTLELAEAVGNVPVARRESWNLHEEADSCSLLHLAFAIRMSYIIWGEVSAPTAEAFVSRVVKYPVPVSCCDVTPGHTKLAMSLPPVDKDATVVTELPEWDIFDQVTRQQYTEALWRLQNGHSGAANPLRRMLSVQQAEVQPPLSMLSSYTVASAAIDGPPAIFDADALYPDVKNVWTTKKVLSDGQRFMQAVIQAAQAAADAAKGTPTVSKGKKSRPTPLARKALGNKQTDGSDDDGAKEEQRLPDYGLLSLVRALGFAVPSSTDFLGHGAATATSRNSRNTKKTKRSPAAKNGLVSEMAVSAALQEAYSEKLIVQLQDFAARVAALLSPVHCSSPVGVLEVADAGVNVEELPLTIRAQGRLSCSGLTAEMTSNMSRHSSSHSVSHEKDSRVWIGDAVESVHTVPAAPVPTWVPLFSRPASVVKHSSAPAPTGPSLDVSKLYAICAALSMT